MHICGEIPIATSLEPFTEILASSTTRRPFRRTSVMASTKAFDKTTLEDYLYEDSGERPEEPNSNPKNVTRKKPSQATTNSLFTTTLKENLSTKRPTTLTQKLSQTTTLPAITTRRTSGPISTTKSSLDYDDYLEYDDALKMRISEVTSLTKISEPVCYMIRYHGMDFI